MAIETISNINDANQKKRLAFVSSIFEDVLKLVVRSHCRSFPLLFGPRLTRFIMLSRRVSARSPMKKIFLSHITTLSTAFKSTYTQLGRTLDWISSSLARVPSLQIHLALSFVSPIPLLATMTKSVLKTRSLRCPLLEKPWDPHYNTSCLESSGGLAQPMHKAGSFKNTCPGGRCNKILTI